MCRARIAVEECIGAKQDRRVGAVHEFRHDAVVQRAWIQEHRHPADERHDQSARQAERVEHGHHVEELVRAVDRDAMQALESVGENVFMAQHHAFGRTFAARREQDGGRIIGFARHLRFIARPPACDLIAKANRSLDVFEINDLVLGFELGQHLGQAALFDKNPRGENGLHVCRLARRQHVGGARRVVEHGRHAANCLQGKEGDGNARRIGQQHADAGTFRGVRDQLGT